jgi:hypothetical protein
MLEERKPLKDAGSQLASPQPNLKQIPERPKEKEETI